VSLLICLAQKNDSFVTSVTLCRPLLFRHLATHGIAPHGAAEFAIAVKVFHGRAVF
jgi:hypothetical protein